MELFGLFQSNFSDAYKNIKGLAILGITVEEHHAEILNEISNYLFEHHTNSGEKVFDLNKDYKYYFVDFMKLGINLNTDELSWWEFNAILDSLFITDSVISEVIQMRTYKKPNKNHKQAEMEEHKAREKLKRKYALHDKESVDANLERLYNYVLSGKDK